MVLFEYIFDIIRGKFCLMVWIGVVQYTDDFQVRLGHGKVSIFNLKGIDVVRVFDVFVNYSHVQLLGHLVDNDRNTCVIRVNIVD